MAVCITIQKIGMATVEEIIENILKGGTNISEKQVNDVIDKLRKQQIISIDLANKDEEGQIVKRYCMRTIKLTIPENAQIKDIIYSNDDVIVEQLKVLKDELDKSKKLNKKGLRLNDYYPIRMRLLSKGKIEGFFPDSKGVLRHYKNSKGNPVFYFKHFRGFMRENIGLINISDYAIPRIKLYKFEVTKINGKLFTEDRYITNIETIGKGGGGRGTRSVEVLPEGSEIILEILIPSDLIKIDKAKHMMELLFKYADNFGGNSKMSENTGFELVNCEVEIPILSD